MVDDVFSVGVNVDETGSDGETVDVDDFSRATGPRYIADGDDAAVLDGDVAFERRAAGAVVNQAVAQNEIRRGVYANYKTKSCEKRPHFRPRRFGQRSQRHQASGWCRVRRRVAV